MLILGASGVPARQLPASLYPLQVDMTLLRPGGLGVNGMPHNPSIVVHDGRLLAIVRVLFLPQRASLTRIGHVDDEWHMVDQHLVLDLTGGPRNRHGMTHGFEDCRLVSWKSRLIASATTCDRILGDPRPKIALLDFDDTRNVAAAHVQPSRRHEKNWMPVVDADRLRFVYSADPLILLDYDETARLVRPSPCDVALRSCAIRGSSQLVPYDGGYLAVVHEVRNERTHAREKDKFAYYHRLALFDREARLVRTSDPFYFRDIGIEFCAGLAEWRSQFVLSFGVADREAWLAVLHRDVVKRMLP